ncbi:MAG: tyrosine-type recombinase/integrase, partial [Salinisphaera sp.]|nr:tyrosine-type recombinase/integrase [Salinisphaera sp.]
MSERVLFAVQNWGLGHASRSLVLIRALVARLHREGLGGRSLQRLLSTLRGFYGFLIREGLARDNPALDIRAPKSGRRLPKALDADQVRHLLDNPDGDSPLIRRDQAMLELFYACGLRLAELIGLNLDDLDLREG